MEKGHMTVRRYKPTSFELRAAIDALNSKRLKDKANGIYGRETSKIILQLLDVLET